MNKIIYVIGLLVLIAGCSSEPTDDKSGMNGDGKTGEDVAEVIATEKIFPADFREIGFYREESPHYTYLLKVANEQEQYEKLWGYFRLENEAPKVNLNEKKVMFFSLEESGSCPLELKGENIHQNDDIEMLVVEVSNTNSEGEMCTLDATPRTFVIEIDKEAAFSENARIHEHEIETTIPIN